MSNQQAALRHRFGLAAVPPPIVFDPVPSGKVWGGLGDPNGQLSKAEAEAAFVDWLGRAYPGLVEAMLEALGADEIIVASDGNLGETEQQSIWGQLLNMAERALPMYLQYDAQREILDVQLDRARAGLPPLETNQYAPSVQLGLDKETIRNMAEEAAARAREMGAGLMSGPMPWVIGGSVIALAFLLTQKKRKR